MNRKMLQSSLWTTIFMSAFLLGWGFWGPVDATIADQTAADAGPSHSEIQAAINRVFPALVRIHVVVEEPSGGRMERAQASGSGVIISPEGHVVTNHHVAGNAVRLSCTLPDGEEIEAALVGTDALSDIAVLKLQLEKRKHPETPLGVAVWGDSDQLKVGDVVLAMGSPMAVSQSVTRGIVSNTRLVMPRSLGGQFRLDGEDVGQIVRWIGHDAVIYSGNSGGPLVNLRGEVVGINELGLGSLGGAIPSNLAKQVVAELIAHGRVRRSWLGLELQPRLKSSPLEHGVLIAGVVPDSPAEHAGLKAGDWLIRFCGEDVDAELPEQLPPLNQKFFSVPVGEEVELTIIRDGTEQTVKLKTVPLEKALGEPLELKAWGIAVRNITRLMALERHRSDTRGALVDSVRGGGGAATAKLPLQPGDIILRVNQQPIDNAAALQKLTESLVEGKRERVPVLVEIERDGEYLLTVVKLGREEEKHRPVSASKPWPAMSTQVLTPELAEHLGMPGQRGVRVTEVYKSQAAECAGVQVGDVIIAVNGRKVEASQPGDQEVFETMIRRLPLGKEAELEIIREGKSLKVNLPLEAPPATDEQAQQLVDLDFDFTARELTYRDRLNKRLPDDFQGLLLAKVENGGWAALGGLRGGDLLMSINGKPTSNIAALKEVLEQVRKEKPRFVVCIVRRGIHTLFCEIEPDYR